METSTMILIVIAAICFLAPFFIWIGHNFLLKSNKISISNKKKLLLFSFVTGFTLGIIMVIIAVLTN